VDFKKTKIYPRELRKFWKEKIFFLDCLTLEDELDRLSRKDSNKLPFYAAEYPRREHI
jgi:hypothetical protein